MRPFLFYIGGLGAAACTGRVIGGTPTGASSHETSVAGPAAPAPSINPTVNPTPGSTPPRTPGPQVPTRYADASPGSSCAQGTGSYWPVDASAPPPTPAACAGGQPWTVLGPSVANGIALSGCDIYWRTRSAIMRTPKAGGPAETFLVTQSDGLSIWVDATHVYWDEQGNPTAVFSAPLDGSSSPVRVVDPVTYWAPAGGSVYFFDGSGLSEIGAMGGHSTLLAPGASAGAAPGIDSTGVYWGMGTSGDAGPTGVLKLTFATGQVAPVAPAMEVPFVYADGSHVIWVDEPGYLGLATIWASGPGGAQPRSVATGQLGVLGLTSDGTSAYWVTSDGKGALGMCSVWAATLAGGSPRLLACGLNGFLYQSIAVDDTDVYFSTYGAIVKVPKG